MNEIIEKDVSELQSKGKKFKFSIKRTLLGVISAALVFPSIPNVEYQIALKKANNSTYIEEVLSTDQSREEQIAQIFAEAIENNNNIPDDIKDRVIESFTTQVINRAGGFFTDETIRNMYAVASTEKITEMSSFSKEHGWWGGDYNSYTNTYSLYASTEQSNSSLIAHEQLHAILKKGLIDTGLTNGLNGYGMNEAFTTLFGENDYSYSQESNIVDILGAIIGYNDLVQYYVNRDLSGLKKELNQYLSPKETNKLIRNIDLDVFSGYLETFLEKNNIPYNADKLYESAKSRRLQNIESLKKIFENKYGVSIEESKLGQLIFNSLFFIDDDKFDPHQSYYTITFSDENNIKISMFNGSIDGIANGIINKSMEQITVDENESAETIIAKEFNLDEIRGYSLNSINNSQTNVRIHGISFIVNKDDLETFNYEQAFNDAITRIQATKDITMEEDREN